MTVHLWLVSKGETSDHTIQLRHPQRNTLYIFPFTGQKTIGSENAAWPPDDGHKDARNMLRNYWLPIKSLFVASSWSHLYLLNIVLFADFHASPACPSESGNIKMKMSLEQLWNESDRVKPKYWETNLSQWCFVHNKSPMERPDIEPRTPRGEVGK